MEVELAIASRRETRLYRPDAVPDEVVHEILEAGRLSGSGRNRQPWRFVVVRSRTLLDALAPTVSRPSNLEGAPLLVSIALDGEGGMRAFDAGRAGQNMMLAAHAHGVGACPNCFVDKDAAAALLELEPGQELLVGISFGYPRSPRDPRRRSVEQWRARAERLPLAEVVQAWL